jgi:hypothetical protein
MDDYSGFDYLLDFLSESNLFQDYQDFKDNQGLPKGADF